MSELNLIIPGLIWSEVDDLEYILHGAKFETITKIIAKSRRFDYDFNYSDLIYGHDFSDNKLSLAENYAKKLGLPVGCNYILLEPTNLRADRDRLLIAESDILQLNEVESLNLLNILNQHFNQDDIYFSYISEHLWLAQLPFSVKHFKTCPIVDIIGCNIDEYLPSGESYLLLHRILNEVQMLFHNFELETKREEEGLVAVNSVWFWDKTYKQLPSELNQIIKPESGNFFVEAGFINSNTAILLDKAYFPLCYQDSFAWVENLNLLDRHLGTVLGLLQSGKIRYLKLWVPQKNKTIVMHLNKMSLYKFWKKGNYKQLVADFQ